MIAIVYHTRRRITRGRVYFLYVKHGQRKIFPSGFSLCPSKPLLRSLLFLYFDQLLGLPIQFDQKSGEGGTDRAKGQAAHHERTAGAAASGGGGAAGVPGRDRTVPYRLRAAGPGGGDLLLLPAEALEVLRGPAGGQDYPARDAGELAGEAAGGGLRPQHGEFLSFGSERFLGLHRAPGVSVSGTTEGGGEASPAGAHPGGVLPPAADGQGYGQGADIPFNEGVRHGGASGAGPPGADGGGGSGGPGGLRAEPEAADLNGAEVLTEGAAKLCGARGDPVGAGVSDEGRQADAPDVYLRGDEAGVRGGAADGWAGESEGAEEAVSVQQSSGRKQHCAAGGAGAGEAAGAGAVIHWVGRSKID